MTKKSKPIIRFLDQSVQPSKMTEGLANHMKRVVGFVDAKNILSLFDTFDLEANPRSAKVGHVTAEIMQTLQSSPDLFPFKSKGILIGCAKSRELERNRYELEINDPTTEGILDGGHNMLAIGLHLLSPFLSEAELKKIKFWDSMKEAWHSHRSQIGDDEQSLRFLVPVEMVVPTADDDETLDLFMSSLLDICAARNNNAQLADEAKANKKGYYDAIRDYMDADFSKRVEWRTNTWEDDTEKRPIKVRDLVAFSWLPLNVLNKANALPKDTSVTPQNIYRNKGECSSRFNELMAMDDVTVENGAKAELVHDGIKSAFKILADLPKLFDLIYERFPESYNSNNLKFGARKLVKIYDPDHKKALKADGRDHSGYMSSQPVTPMFRNKVKYSYPDGLIAPIFYGLTALMEVKGDKVRWAVDDPAKFVCDHLVEIAGSFKLVLEMGEWDPQRIAKNPNSHEFAVQQFQSALLRQSILEEKASK